MSNLHISGDNTIKSIPIVLFDDVKTIIFLCLEIKQKMKYRQKYLPFDSTFNMI